MPRKSKKESPCLLVTEPQAENAGVVTGIDWSSVRDRELVRLGQDEIHYQQAMVELWERYKRRLYFYIKYKTSRARYSDESQERYVIEDILHNVFCDVLENLREYRPQYEVSTWVYTITNKHVVRYIREIQKYQGRTIDLDETVESNVFVSDSNKPDQEYELKEFERIVVSFVQSLKRSLDQEVFILYLQNLHTKNIAERMKHSQDATRARLNRVIRRFKVFLRKYYPEYLNSVTLSQIRNLNIAVKSTCAVMDAKVGERNA